MCCAARFERRQPFVGVLPAEFFPRHMVAGDLAAFEPGQAESDLGLEIGPHLFRFGFVTRASRQAEPFVGFGAPVPDVVRAVSGASNADNCCSLVRRRSSRLRLSHDVLLFRMLWLEPAGCW